ncbi:MAG: adenylate/guanylate cyclase domain-containing protein [Deltaproteobacteria bacterium]|nr:adenylate/guanylate cyclase domain-containing protein [Deltaproteobacteria bacterium]
MASLSALGKGFWAIGNIGITSDIRPEEAKHIQFFNIGIFMMGVINLGYFFQSMSDESIPIIVSFAQISTSALCLLVYLFHVQGRYNTARIFGFLLFYAVSLVTHTLTGNEVVDHFFIFVGIAYAFLVFPRKEKRSMTAIIALGFICYLSTFILYQHVVPATRVDPSNLHLTNQVLLHVIFIVFTVLMISARNFTDKTEDTLMEEREKLADMAALLKKMFGRYLSTEVMNSLLENPSALELGGERRRVTIMMTDLRGFTALSERLEPEQVVQMLNAYFEVMVDVVLKYNGTINEIIGDALLVIFGAPQEMPDRAQRAIACAIEMQNAMAQVNEENCAQGLPELDMGIGLNETEVVVGNIGSSKRIKYAVVGSGVNMTSRIESYTVGGQVLISESVRQEAGEVLRIDAQRDVLPKGAETPLRIYEVGGIAGRFNLALEEKKSALVTLARQISLRCRVLEEKNVGRKRLEGSIIRLSKNCAEVALGAPFDMMTNLKMNLKGVDEKLSARDFYGKIMKRSGEKGETYVVHFTSVPPEVDAYFQSHRQHAQGPEAG